MKRRMAAILVADVVGYSGLMEADEDGTAQRLGNCRNSIDAEVAKCDGRLFKAMGGAVLVEFGSPINARPNHPSSAKLTEGNRRNAS
jgi:adenylate cyclase